MMNAVLRLEHSVEVDVARPFVWRHRTDVSTWSDPPATFVIDGPFVAGTAGRTMMPGHAPLAWIVADVRPEEAFALEMPLDGALLRFEWRFATLTPFRTRLTQTITLTGARAAAFADRVRSGFEPTLVDGMARIAADLTKAALGTGEDR